MLARLKLSTSRPLPRPLAIAGAERRLFPRRDSKAIAAGHRLDHSLTARRNPHLTLTLSDVSLGGLSATTDTPLGEGERLAVTIPSHGFNGGWSARGRVVRCEAGKVGYRVAVAFDLEYDPMPLAA